MFRARPVGSLWCTKEVYCLPSVTPLPERPVGDGPVWPLDCLFATDASTWCFVGCQLSQLVDCKCVRSDLPAALDCLLRERLCSRNPGLPTASPEPLPEDHRKGSPWPVSVPPSLPPSLPCRTLASGLQMTPMPRRAPSRDQRQHQRKRSLREARRVWESSAHRQEQPLLGASPAAGKGRGAAPPSSCDGKARGPPWIAGLQASSCDPSTVIHPCLALLQPPTSTRCLTLPLLRFTSLAFPCNSVSTSSPHSWQEGTSCIPPPFSAPSASAIFESTGNIRHREPPSSFEKTAWLSLALQNTEAPSTGCNERRNSRASPGLPPRLPP